MATVFRNVKLGKILKVKHVRRLLLLLSGGSQIFLSVVFLQTKNLIVQGYRQEHRQEERSSKN